MKYNINDKVYAVCCGYKVTENTIFKIETGVASSNVYYYLEDVSTGLRIKYLRYVEDELYVNKIDADAALARTQVKRQALSAEEQLIRAQQQKKEYDAFIKQCEVNSAKKIALDHNKDGFLFRDATKEEIQFWEESAEEMVDALKLCELPKTLTIENDKIIYVYEQVSKVSKGTKVNV